MSEKIYSWLLQLYPTHFRETYGEEALQLMRDRARDEKGFFLKLRLWLDLLADLAVSHPRLARPQLAGAAAQQGSIGTPSFSVLEDRWPRTDALFLGCVLSLSVLSVFALANRFSGTHRQISGSLSSWSAPAPFDARAGKDSVSSGKQSDPPTPKESEPTRVVSPWQSIDVTAHDVRFVNVEKDVKIEVLDWGGSGRPLILLAGAGSDAHVFDHFAPSLTATHHVYGITRRGFGKSSKPAPSVSNYSATRLGDDVLAVIDALKVQRPILAGHSLAGEELSSVGSRYPGKVAGLVYLDAGYAFAYYDRAHGDLWLDLIDLRKRIDEMQSGTGDRKQLWQDILADVSHLNRPLEDLTKQLASMPSLRTPESIDRAIQFGWEKYTEIPAPILAIFAVPQGGNVRLTTQVNAFEAGLPTARVVRLKNAHHFVFRSNEQDVLREMNAFSEKLR